MPPVTNTAAPETTRRDTRTPMRRTPRLTLNRAAADAPLFHAWRA